MRHLLVVALVMAMLHLAPSAHPQETRPQSDGHRLHRVSLIRIIANPRDYDGEHVRVIGYLAGAGLDDAPGVFVSDSDGRNGVLSNAVDLTVRNSTKIRAMYGKYVVVSGLYHAPPPHGDFNGYIDDILVLEPLNARPK